ncbi:hypothetical protein BJF79_29550 [Actinomadura sp. CNU-125]|uniref:hypothetical protein n=1 Tax=Actinomadura sp. CNU-125 TaxID=1904961 RepID=UPI0009596595|nr:hypothetical protein [Actinomadura sp. CNU-125]OLT37381.1 hypothetical protein BJF79_29550 [Actinomadura sp. CNU-125]
MNAAQKTVKALLIITALLAGTVVGLFTGMLGRIDGGSIPDAIQVGGGAFGATVLLIFGGCALWYNAQNREP